VRGGAGVDPPHRGPGGEGCGGWAWHMLPATSSTSSSTAGYLINMAPSTRSASLCFTKQGGLVCKYPILDFKT
jgi:hypothetical protein